MLMSMLYFMLTNLYLSNDGHVGVIQNDKSRHQLTQSLHKTVRIMWTAKWVKNNRWWRYQSKLPRLSLSVNTSVRRLIHNFTTSVTVKNGEASTWGKQILKNNFMLHFQNPFSII